MNVSESLSMRVLNHADNHRLCEMTNVARCCCCCCVFMYMHTFFLITRAESSALKCIIHTGNCSYRSSGGESFIDLSTQCPNLRALSSAKSRSLYTNTLSAALWLSWKKWRTWKRRRINCFQKKKMLSAPEALWIFAVWINSNAGVGPPH